MSTPRQVSHSCSPSSWIEFLMPPLDRKCLADFIPSKSEQGYPTIVWANFFPGYRPLEGQCSSSTALQGGWTDGFPDTTPPQDIRECIRYMASITASAILSPCSLTHSSLR